jgi:hypothetical protein
MVLAYLAETRSVSLTLADVPFGVPISKCEGVVRGACSGASPDRHFWDIAGTAPS